MTVKELADKLSLSIISGEKGVNREIKGGYVSDLLSDVMGNADANYVWITLQTHKNIMAIASLKDLAAIVLVKGNQPDEDTLEKSNSDELPILGTKQEAFEIAGEIYKLIQDK